MGKDLILLVRPMAQHREHKIIVPQKPVEPKNCQAPFMNTLVITYYICIY